MRGGRRGALSRQATANRRCTVTAQGGQPKKLGGEPKADLVAGRQAAKKDDGATEPN